VTGCVLARRVQDVLAAARDDGPAAGERAARRERAKAARGGARVEHAAGRGDRGDEVTGRHSEVDGMDVPPVEAVGDCRAQRDRGGGDRGEGVEKALAVAYRLCWTALGPGRPGEYGAVDGRDGLAKPVRLPAVGGRELR